MPHHYQAQHAIAILGGDAVVGNALCLLLRGDSYHTRIIEEKPTRVVEELLDGVDVLLAPGLSNGPREAILSAMRAPPRRRRYRSSHSLPSWERYSMIRACPWRGQAALRSWCGRSRPYLPPLRAGKGRDRFRLYRRSRIDRASPVLSLCKLSRYSR